MRRTAGRPPLRPKPRPSTSGKRIERRLELACVPFHSSRFAHQPGPDEVVIQCHAQPGAVDPAVIWRLGFLFVAVIVTVYTIAIGFLATYRISRESHEENLRRLAGAPPSS